MFSYKEVCPCGLNAPTISSPFFSFAGLNPAAGVALSLVSTILSVVEKHLVAYLDYKRLMAVIIIIICGFNLIILMKSLYSVIKVPRIL